MRERNFSNLSDCNIWLNIDKPIGYSSAKVVAIVKRITGARKVGHGGTLDPFASGVLPVALNKATKSSEQWMSATKKYFFHICWGEFRDSDDIEGNVTETSDLHPSNTEIISILPFFIGKQKQIPSRFSAIKINGQRAYELARKGIEFEVREREIEIFSIKLLSNSDEFAAFEIECSKGTYVRTLARNICEKISDNFLRREEKSLKICGYVSRLVRLSVGDFLYKKRITLDLLKLANSYAGAGCPLLQLSVC